MAVQIPTLNELYTSIKGDLESEVNVNISFFGKSYLRVLAGVQAGKLKLYYLAIANLQRNIFPDLAESEAVGGTLERFGRVKLNRNPFPAVAGQYDVQVTGQIGASIPVNSTFKSDDDSVNPGKLFTLDTAFTFTGTTGTINLRSLEPGLDARLNVGNTLTATAPILNADELVTVTVETITPLSAESLEDYRSKIVEAFQLEPQGGAGTDYKLWANDAQGVERVYPYAKSGFSNEIEIFVEATIADSIDGKGTPSAGLLTDVEDVVNFDPDTGKPLNERGRKPLTVLNIDYNPITLADIDIEIAGYVGLTPAIETTIFNALKEQLATIRPFVASSDIIQNKNDIYNINKIIFTIQSEVNTAVFSTVTLKINTVANASYQFLGGEIPFLNSVTYV